LNAIHEAVPSLCPKAFAYGALADSRGWYLVTDFLDFSTAGDARGGQSLAAKIAKLHGTPPPKEYAGKFGFPVPTCCGSTVQDNTWEGSWAEFFGKRRLMRILEESERKNGADGELRGCVESTVDVVVPRLLGGLKDVRPALVHGDLWSGNASRGVIGDGNGKAEGVVFDPSVRVLLFFKENVKRWVELT
jgi:fructosamine-3-kinase